MGLVVIFYWGRLRVRWADLLKLFSEKDFSEIKQAESPNSSTHFRSGDSVTEEKPGRGGPKRPDWHLIAALAATIWEREPDIRNSDKGTCDRTGKILLATKYKFPSRKYEYNPSLELFIRLAIVPVEQARRLCPMTDESIFKKRIQHRDEKPEMLYLASALASIIANRNGKKWMNSSEDERRTWIARILESAGVVDSDNRTVSADSNLIGQALLAVNEAKRRYEQVCPEFPAEQE